MRLKSMLRKLILFSGEDATILRECDWPLQRRYAFVGLFVLGIFLGCFLSCTYAIYSFFEHNLFLSVPIGIFFGCMIVCIYLLLLYTLVPNHLPTREEKGWSGLSYCLRLAFIVLLAVILARPLSVFLFDAYLDQDIEQYKKELLISHLMVADSLLIEQEKTIAIRYIQDLGLNTSFSNEDAIQAHSILLKVGKDTSFLQDVTELQRQVAVLSTEPIKNKQTIDALTERLYTMANEEYDDDKAFLANVALNLLQGNTPATKVESLSQSFTRSIRALVEKKKNSQENLLRLLDKSSFFVHKIKLLSTKYPLSWMIDFAIIFVFLFPVYLNMSGRRLNVYLEQRQSIERHIIEEAYQLFKLEYSRIMKQVTGRDIQYFEPFADAPFNTIRKSEAKELKQQQDLLNKIYAAR